MTSYADDLAQLWADHLAPRKPDAPTAVNLFSGAGGSSLGFSAAGYREVLAAEWDKTAARVFRQNSPGVEVYEGDITQMDPGVLDLEPGTLDLCAASPPCQAFSSTGLRRTADPRAQLWREVVRLASAWQPRFVVIENVKGLAAGKMRLVLRDICAVLRNIGYSVGVRLIDASLLGVPQRRERVFVCAARIGAGGIPAFPRPSGRVRTVRDAWEGLGDPGEFIVPSGKGAALAPLVQPGSQGSKALKARGGRETNWNAKRLSFDKPSMTLVREFRASTCSGYLHPVEQRFIGTRELSRIGSFPDEFSWLDLDYASIHHLIGNSVCPLVAQAIGAALASSTA